MANEYEAQWWWKYGKPQDFWTLNHNMMKEVIDKFGLEVAKAEVLPLRLELQASEQVAEPAAKSRAIKPRPFPGGMRIPHLHYGGDVYLVPEEKWQAISQTFLGKFQDKLKNARNVSFEQIMELSETIDSM